MACLCGTRKHRSDLGRDPPAGAHAAGVQYSRNAVQAEDAAGPNLPDERGDVLREAPRSLGSVRRSNRSLLGEVPRVIELSTLPLACSRGGAGALAQ